MKWYAIKNLKKDIWSVGTFGNLLKNMPYKEKYLNTTNFKVLGPFDCCKSATEATQEGEE